MKADTQEELVKLWVSCMYMYYMWTIIQGCIQKFLDWLPGVTTANGTAVCH